MTFDDPFAKLEHQAERLVDGLTALQSSLPSDVIEQAKELKQGIGRTSRALQSRRAADLRAGLDTVERRTQEAEVARERAESDAKIERLEREVRALLDPTRAEARTFYELRRGELAQDIAAVRKRREQLEARLAGSTGATEMERSRDAALAASIHAEEQALSGELARIERNLATIGR
ncbi:MAG: hypothetical protein HOW73_17215 [Polyangiaceae bacterium]|nr:hypothetical protein [Polyangiaceae bacterium]